MRHEAESPEQTGRGSKYSVVVYLVIFFVLAIALVLLSYFVQGRRSSNSYAMLRSEYQQSLEQHRDRLEDLKGEIDAQKETIAALEALVEQNAGDASAALEQRAADAEKRAKELEEEIETLRGELKTLREAVENLEFGEEEE